MKYLATIPNHWAKADTIWEAKRLLRSQAGVDWARYRDFSIYEVPDDYYIDEMGAAHGSAKAKLIRGKELRDG